MITLPGMNPSIKPFLPSRMVSLNSRLYWCGWTPKHARNCAVKSFSSAFSLLVPAHWWANADSLLRSSLGVIFANRNPSGKASSHMPDSTPFSTMEMRVGSIQRTRCRRCINLCGLQLPLVAFGHVEDNVKASTRARNKFELSYPIVLATSCCKPNGKKALLPLRRHECRQINRPPSSCAQLRRTGDGATAYDGGH